MPGRRRPPSQADLLAAFAALGIAPQYVNQKLNSAVSRAEFRKQFEALQEEARLAWRKRAFALHPDRGGDENEFKRVKELYELIERVGLVPPPPPRPVHQPAVRFYVNYGVYRTRTTSTASSHTSTRTDDWTSF